MKVLLDAAASEYTSQSNTVINYFLNLVDRAQYDSFNKIVDNRENKAILIKGTHELRKNLNKDFMKEVIRSYGNHILGLLEFTFKELSNDIIISEQEKNSVTYNTYNFLKFDGFSESNGSELKVLYLEKPDFQNLLFSHENSIKFNRTKDEIKDIIYRYVQAVMNFSFNKITPRIFIETYRFIHQQIGKSRDDVDWLYTGILQPESRQFCIDRQGKIFTTDEVKEWKDLKWPQKQPFKYDPWRDCGGFGCNHILKPVKKKTEKRWVKSPFGIMFFK